MLACQERKPHGYFVPLVANSSAFTQTCWLTLNAQLAKNWSDGFQESHLFDLMSSCVKCHSVYWSRGQSCITPLCVVYWAIRGLLCQYTSPCWKSGLNDFWAALNGKKCFVVIACIPTINCMFVCWGGWNTAPQVLSQHSNNAVLVFNFLEEGIWYFLFLEEMLFLVALISPDKYGSFVFLGDRAPQKSNSTSASARMFQMWKT